MVSLFFEADLWLYEKPFCLSFLHCIEALTRLSGFDFEA